MELQQKHYLFRRMDGYAGFRHGQVYALTPDAWDDGSGTVTVEMPHAPSAGRRAGQSTAEPPVYRTLVPIPTVSVNVKEPAGHSRAALCPARR